MKRFQFVAVCLALCASVYAASPTFVTGRMIDRRNGLTDAQYEVLWAMGRNPQISQTVARDWIFRAGRYQNVTNWLDICGATNNFAALSYKLQGDNFQLEEVNLNLRTINSQLQSDLSKWIGDCETYSNLCVVLDGQVKAATAKIQDEIADLQAKIEKYEEYKTKYPLLKAVWNALINDAQNRIKILQALT